MKNSIIVVQTIMILAAIFYTNLIQTRLDGANIKVEVWRKNYENAREYIDRSRLIGPQNSASAVLRIQEK